jgi:hypothetical protein
VTDSSTPGPNFTSPVTPYTSPNAPPLGSETGSGGGSIPASSQVPALEMAWVEAPPFVSAGSGSGSSSSSQTYPPCPDISVDLGSLQDAENSMLTAAFNIVQAYDNLAMLFQDYQSWVYGQNAVDIVEQWTGAIESTGGYTTTVSPSEIQGMAQSFANGSDGQPGMNAQQEYLLQSIGNSMALVGEFIAVLNAAGGAYATADSNSAMPMMNAGQPVETSGS